jgi:hypothetical protein
MTTTTYADQTAYPEIYRKTYWGCFTTQQRQLPEEDYIISNRNKFIREYQIKCCRQKAPQYLYKIMSLDEGLDHVELYETLDDDDYFIVLSSPYGVEKPKTHIKNGWIEIYQMYSSDARTFLKRIPKRQNSLV